MRVIPGVIQYIIDDSPDTPADPASCDTIRWDHDGEWEDKSRREEVLAVYAEKLIRNYPEHFQMPKDHSKRAGKHTVQTWFQAFALMSYF